MAPIEIKPELPKGLSIPDLVNLTLHHPLVGMVLFLALLVIIFVLPNGALKAIIEGHYARKQLQDRLKHDREALTTKMSKRAKRRQRGRSGRK